ncbi:MAG: hypothetical protein ACRDTE_09005 [Pseudonocardiaceae bacterium]
MTSYGHVIAALRGLLGAPEADDRDAPDLARDAAANDLVTPQLVETVEGLAVLKNLSRRDGAGTGLSVEQADDYVELVAAALYVLYTVRPEPRATSSRHSECVRAFAPLSSLARASSVDAGVVLSVA